jgi:rubrerythrin
MLTRLRNWFEGRTPDGRRPTKYDLREAVVGDHLRPFELYDEMCAYQAEQRMPQMREEQARIDADFIRVSEKYSGPDYIEHHAKTSEQWKERAAKKQEGPVRYDKLKCPGCASTWWVSVRDSDVCNCPSCGAPENIIVDTWEPKPPQTTVPYYPEGMSTHFMPMAVHTTDFSTMAWPTQSTNAPLLPRNWRIDE